MAPPDPEPLYVAFGAAVRDARVAKGLSQAALAGLVEVPRTYVVEVEKGRRNVTLRNIQRFAAALDMSLADLMADTGRRHSPPDHR